MVEKTGPTSDRSVPLAPFPPPALTFRAGTSACPLSVLVEAGHPLQPRALQDSRGMYGWGDRPLTRPAHTPPPGPPRSGSRTPLPEREGRKPNKDAAIFERIFL